MASGQSAEEVNAQYEQGPAQIGSNIADSSNYSSFQWLLAWAVFLVMMILIARTRIGYLLIYYGLALLVLFLLVTQYKWFASTLAPFASLKPGGVVDTSTNSSQEPKTPAVGAQPGAAEALTTLQSLPRSK